VRDLSSSDAVRVQIFCRLVNKLSRISPELFIALTILDAKRILCWLVAIVGNGYACRPQGITIMTATLADETMAKKKAAASAGPKRYGTLVRVSDDFADALRKASALQGVSMADFADANLLAVVQKLYVDTLARESKRMGGKP
jgi:hypothetical protein